MSHDLETEFADLAEALREARPAPEPEFVERLDQAVADSFPPEWADEAALGKAGHGGIGTLTERFRRRMRGRRVLLPAMATFAGLIVVATVIAAVESGRLGDGNGEPTETGNRVLSAGGVDSATEDAAMPESTASPRSAESGAIYEGARLATPARKDAAVPGGSRQRVVALEARITLGTDPDGTQDVANEVVAVTDEHNGIVMDSEVIDGEAGKAGASFSLLIPTARIDSAVAALSGIADLKSRSQELTDITAPTNRTEDDIAVTRARIRSLLGELEDAPDEETRRELEWGLRSERSRLGFLEARLKRLERRADYTPVEVRVETGGDTSSDDESGWGLGDAVDDAGRLLGVAAGVTVLALAVAIPIGIVVLIALAINRAWVRRSRRRALGDE